MSDPRPPAGLPDAPWANAQLHDLLARSEDRLRSIEAKGPGLATVAAIVAAAVLVAIPGGWQRSDAAARALLVAAAVYALFSLVTPIYLVGPLGRAQLWTADLETAAKQSSPEQWLAERAAEAAMTNTGRVMRLSNLQWAARTDLIWAITTLVLWVILVPASGALTRHRHSHAPTLCMSFYSESRRDRGHAGVAGLPVHFGRWGEKPHWRCEANPRHRTRIARSHLRLPKMRAIVPPRELKKLDKQFGLDGARGSGWLF